MKLNNWTTTLSDLIESRRHRPFEWGVHDCMLWPSDVVEALTGKDPSAGLRGTYSTALSAMRIVKAHGGLKDLVTEQLGQDPVSLSHAQRGDIVMHTSNGLLCGGVNLGEFGVFVGAGHTGLQFVPHKQLETFSWRVE